MWDSSFPPDRLSRTLFVSRLLPSHWASNPSEVLRLEKIGDQNKVTWHGASTDGSDMLPCSESPSPHPPCHTCGTPPLGPSPSRNLGTGARSATTAVVTSNRCTLVEA